MWIQVLLYIAILLVKIVEVTLATTRIVLITRGERLKGAFIGFFEVCIWVVLVSTVLKDISSDPIKLFVYALGFALGNFLGSVFEEKLAIGTTRVEVIVKETDGIELISRIRENGYAVTSISGEGMNSKRTVLIMHVKRKMASKLIRLIHQYQENVVITVNEIKPVYGGFGTLKK
jgi:uncharacterized protein YebE (UPF0316 family)